MIREGEDGLELPVDRLGEGEGIETIAERDEGGDLGAVDLGVGARLHALQRGARGIVASAQPGADALFADELDGRQEEVLEQTELVGVEGVDGGESRARVVADVARAACGRGSSSFVRCGRCRLSGRAGRG
jgi:hypothetical protein